ncbi:MAG: GspH/FimT family pseudopilin [Pseudomonadota bacterium]
MSRLAVNRGFTLIELLIVVAIAVILLRVAVPAMQGTVEASAVNKHVTTFMGDLRYARSEAIKNGAVVVMCRSVNSEAASPSCTTTNPSNVWASGWIIFVDRDSSDDFNTGDTMLRVQGNMPDSGGIGGSSGTVNMFKFRSTGMLSAGMSSFVFNTISVDSSRQKLVCISMQGRARVLPNSTSSCNSSNDS